MRSATLRPTRAAVAFLAGAAMLAGCATTPASAPLAPLGPAGGGDRARVYAEAVAMAQRAAGAGRLREALWRWRIAEAVAPANAAATREAGLAQSRLAAAAEAAEAEGARAAKAGHSAEAQAAYMRALELDPGQPQAREFMRTLLAAQVMNDVNRLAGSTPKAAGRVKDSEKPTGKRKKPSRRVHAGRI